MNWNEQVALITGGADGLGLAAAEHLDSLGVRVALLDREQDKLHAAAARLKGSICMQGDVTSESDVNRAVQQVLAQAQRLDILINCAGITGQTALQSHQVEPGDFERVWRVNVLGSFLTARAALPHMLGRGYGRILHIASIAGKEGNAGMVSYSSSKAAVIGMAKAQGKEYAGTGITVNALAPAVIRTAMVAALPDAQVKYMTDKIPMGRCGTLEELAAMCAFIVSPEASFTTGFTFDLSGGRATY